MLEMSDINDIQQYYYQFDADSFYDTEEFISMDNDSSTEIGKDFIEFESDLGNFHGSDQSEKTLGELKPHMFQMIHTIKKIT